jgi:D-3-phosphoglycerate dehydrogenase
MFKVTMVVNDQPPTPEWVIRQLQEQGIEFTERICTSGSEVVEAARDADVVWLFGGARVFGAEDLPHLKKCRVILRTGTGTDNVPVDEATRLGIVVANTPTATTHTVAEHAIGLLLAVLRKISIQDRLIRQGIWDRDRAWPSWHMVGQTLGLVGFGRIAQHVAKKLSTWEMKIVAADPLVDASTMAAHGVERAELDDLLRRSDFISLHTPLLDQTYHLIGKRELRLMKPRAVLINTSRGKVIDELALIRALKEGWIAAAGLDVLETQPPAPDNPLLTMDNVVLTPHIASYSDDFWDTFRSHSVQTLTEMANERIPLWVVNPQVKPRWEPAR